MYGDVRSITILLYHNQLSFVVSRCCVGFVQTFWTFLGLCWEYQVEIKWGISAPFECCRRWCASGFVSWTFSFGLEAVGIFLQVGQCHECNSMPNGIISQGRPDRLDSDHKTILIHTCTQTPHRQSRISSGMPWIKTEFHLQWRNAVSFSSCHPPFHPTST